MLLTEQDREFINKLHHELIRHIFMYHQFTKQEPRDLRSFLFKHIEDHRNQIIQPLVIEWSRLTIRYHKKRTSRTINLYNTNYSNNVLFLNYVAEIMTRCKNRQDINFTEISKQMHHLMNRELMFSSL